MNWSEFKKELLSKDDKQALNTIFENAKLYTQYLSNANRPIPVEPIMIGALFHNYKILLMLCKDEDNVTEDSINQKLVVLDKEKSLAKTLFDKTCERWRGLLYALHRDDRERLLRMLVDCCCNSLDEGAAKIMMDKVSESNVSVLFLFCLVLQNQKLVERIKKSAKNRENIRANGTLFDYVD